jgi:hypothetical protein
MDNLDLLQKLLLRYTALSLKEINEDLCWIASDISNSLKVTATCGNGGFSGECHALRGTLLTRRDIHLFSVSTNKPNHKYY